MTTTVNRDSQYGQTRARQYVQGDRAVRVQMARELLRDPVELAYVMSWLDDGHRIDLAEYIDARAALLRSAAAPSGSDAARGEGR